MATRSRERIAKKIIRNVKNIQPIRKAKREEGWDYSTTDRIPKYNALKDMNCPKAKPRLKKSHRKHARRLAPISSQSNHHMEQEEEKLHRKAEGYIRVREGLLYKLNALMICWPEQHLTDAQAELRSRKLLMTHLPTKNMDQNEQALQELVLQLQEAGINCVESIVEWMLVAGKHESEPPKYMWKGEDYLCRMYTDLNFLVHSPIKFSKSECFTENNPLLIGPQQRLGRIWAAHLLVSQICNKDNPLEQAPIVMQPKAYRDTICSPEVAPPQLSTKDEFGSENCLDIMFDAKDRPESVLTNNVNATRGSTPKLVAEKLRPKHVEADTAVAENRPLLESTIDSETRNIPIATNMPVEDVTNHTINPNTIRETPRARKISIPRLSESLIERIPNREDKNLLQSFLVYISQFSDSTEVFVTAKNSGFTRAIELIDLLGTLNKELMSNLMDEFTHQTTMTLATAVTIISCLDHLLFPILRIVQAKINQLEAETARSDMSLKDIIQVVEDEYENQAANSEQTQYTPRRANACQMVMSTIYHQHGYLDGTEKFVSMYECQALSGLLDLYLPFISNDLTGKGTADFAKTFKQIENSMDLFSIRENAYLLGSAQKKLVLNTLVVDKSSGLEKVTVVCERGGRILQTSMQQVQVFVTKDRFFPILRIFPYFLCEFGKKKVNGQIVEEAEGHGPRKEWFTLIANEFSCKYALVSDNLEYVRMEEASGGLTALHATGIGAIAKKGFRIRIQDEKSPHQRQEYTILSVTNSDEVLLRKQYTPLKIVDCKLVLEESKIPLLTYVQESETFWLNESTPRNTTSESELQFFGVVLGLAIVNHATFNMHLNILIFKCILLGTPKIELQSLLRAMQLIDPGFDSTWSRIKDLSRADLRVLLEMEELDHREDISSTQDYMLHTLKVRLVDNIEWQINSISNGLFSIIEQSTFEQTCIHFQNFQNIVCGLRNEKEDFSIRNVFAVSMDPEMSLAFRNLFWSVVDEFSVDEKRSFVKFVTGVSHLPLPNTEFFRIELPFTAVCSKDYQDILQRLPQAHTCDNILELPDYLAAWRFTKNIKSDATLTSKQNDEICSWIAKKLCLAMSNTQGYGLDVLAGNIQEESVEHNVVEPQSESEESMHIPSMSRDSSRASISNSHEPTSHIDAIPKSTIVQPESSMLLDSFESFEESCSPTKAANIPPSKTSHPAQPSMLLDSFESIENESFTEAAPINKSTNHKKGIQTPEQKDSAEHFQADNSIESIDLDKKTSANNSHERNDSPNFSSEEYSDEFDQ